MKFLFFSMLGAVGLQLLLSRKATAQHSGVVSFVPGRAYSSIWKKTSPAPMSVADLTRFESAFKLMNSQTGQQMPFNVVVHSDERLTASFSPPIAFTAKIGTELAGFTLETVSA